jgi:hypothetical protein
VTGGEKCLDISYGKVGIFLLDRITARGEHISIGKRFD